MTIAVRQGTQPYRLLLLGFNWVFLFRKRLGGLLKRTRKAESSMYRHAFIAKTVLVVFSCCAVWLPISHSCYEGTVGLSPVDAGSLRVAQCQASPHVFLSRPASRAFPGAPGPCLACFWSHHLFLGKVVFGLGIPQFLRAGAFAAQSPDPAVTIAFDAAFERGPPSSAAA